MQQDGLNYDFVKQQQETGGTRQCCSEFTDDIESLLGCKIKTGSLSFGKEMLKCKKQENWTIVSAFGSLFA